VTKPDPKLTKLTKELSVWLIGTFPGITLFVDEKLQNRSSFKYQEILDQHPEWKDRMQFWNKDTCQGCGASKDKQIHLAVTLGGDGTVLYTAWMFQRRVPPMVAVSLLLLLLSLVFISKSDVSLSATTLTENANTQEIPFIEI
jgi:NAD+ kinase